MRILVTGGAVSQTYRDASRARQELGWTAEVPLEEGLARTVAHFREQVR